MQTFHGAILCFASRRCPLRRKRLDLRSWCVKDKEMRSHLRRLASRMATKTTGAVTLVIYGWSESQPGTLAWVFPSVRAALRAVRAMRNAIRWMIVKGREVFEGEVDIDALRRSGRILMEGAS